MSRFFIPFSGNEPALTTINGHRLVVVSQDPQELLDHLARFGADRVEIYESDDGKRCEDSPYLQRLAETVDCQVVVAPVDVDLEEVLHSLESDLPWIH